MIFGEKYKRREWWGVGILVRVYLRYPRSTEEEVFGSIGSYEFELRGEAGTRAV